MEQPFTHEETGQDQLGSGLPSTTANRSGPAGNTRPRTARTHLVLQARAPAPSTWGTERVVRLTGGPTTYTLKQNKEVHNKPRTEEETPRPWMCPAQLPDATVQCSSNLRTQLPFPARINIVIKVTVVISPPPLPLPTRFIRRVCLLWKLSPRPHQPHRKAPSHPGASFISFACFVFQLILFSDYRLIYVHGKEKKKKKSPNAKKSGKNKIKIIHKPIMAINNLEYFLAAFLSRNMGTHIINKLGTMLFIKFLTYTVLLNVFPTHYHIVFGCAFLKPTWYFILWVWHVVYHFGDVIPEDVVFWGFR